MSDRNFMSFHEWSAAERVHRFYCIPTNYSEHSLKQQSAGKHVSAHRHISLIKSQPVFTLSLTP